MGDAFYTGASFYWTPNSTSSTATLTLTATIRNSINYSGNIRTAKASFYIRTGSSAPYTLTPINGAQNLPVGLVDPTDQSFGTASATVQYNIGNASAATYTIAVLITGGNYTSNQNDVTTDNTITIAKPAPGGIIVGAGYLDNDKSSGFIKGTTTKKTKFDFYVQYTKSMKNFQGGVEITVRSYFDRNGNETPGLLHTYKLKSNAISTLAVGQPTPNQAQFTGKANIAECYTDGRIESIEGNCIMQLDLTDVDPVNGIGDKLGVTIFRSKGGVWYSNNWEVNKTVQAVIVNSEYRNSYISVTGGTVTGATARINTAATSTQVDTPAPTLLFDIKASPNPTTSYFNVKLESDNISQPISMNVVDISGKVIEMRKNLVAGQTFQLGANYRPGMYFVELLQGDRRRIVKLVKQPD
jgi:hypothetical protein